jgi:hypothetical protein
VTHRRAAAWLALAAWAGAAVAAEPALRAEPAWDGWSRSGRSTELAVAIDAAQGGPAELEIIAGPQTLRTSLALRAGESRLLYLPVASHPTVQLRLRHGDTLIEKELRIAESEQPLLARVLSPGAAPDLALAGFHSIDLVASRLPTRADSYSSIDLLIVDAEQVRALAVPQLEALLAHFARCGRGVLVGLDAAQRAVFERAAGCGARRIGFADDLASGTAVLEVLLEAEAGPPPATSELALLQGADLRAWRFVLLIVIGYLAAALAVLTLRRHREAGAALALLAVPLAVAATQLHDDPPRMLVWAEADSGDRIARYAARLQGAGLQRGPLPVVPPESMSATRLCDPERPAQWQWDAEAGRATSVSSGRSLFEPPSLCHAGHFPLARTAQSRPLGEGALELVNPGPAAWPDGVLLWQGRRHAVPPLAAGQRMRLRAAAGEAPRNALERAASTRAPFDGQALLWPLELRGASAVPADASAWLLLRLPAPSSGGGA